MNNYEQIIKQLIDASPSWEKDGGGIRGRTIAPILSGLSSSGGMSEFIPQQFNQNKNETIQKSAKRPVSDLILDGAGKSVATPHPWQILLRTTDADVVQFKVELNSRLYSGLGSWSNIEVSGLNQWTNAGVGYIILFGVVSGGVCTEASIQGPQETLSDRIDFVDGEQSSFAFQLGYLFQDENDNFLLRQNAFHNLTIYNFCVNGSAAIYPIAT